MSSEIIILGVELFVLMLTVAVIVGITARKLRLPYTVGLVIVGVLLLLLGSWLRELESLPFIRLMLDLLNEVVSLEDEVSREIIMGLLVPPLIFEAAFHLRLKDLQDDLLPITLFAIPGVVITMLLVGWVIAWGTGMSFAVAAVFGALIAATDPVAVVALFRSLGVPKRLQVLLEGESLLNDGTAIVVFGIALAVARGGESFTIGSGLLDFVIIAGGGLAIGVAFGWVISQVMHRLDDHLIETALTFVVAYGAYFLAENLHVSGILAVVAAGVLNGNVGPTSMSPSTRIVVANFWEFTAFVANSLVFLLIGLLVDPTLLINQWQGIVLAILAVLGARALVIFGFSFLVKGIPLRWQVVLHWGGLRGAISLALALGLGSGMEELRAMAFGVVLFTLLVQGMTMGPLVKRMGMGEVSAGQEAYNLKQARAVANRASLERLAAMREDGFVSGHTWEIIAPILEADEQGLVGGIKALLLEDETVASRALDSAWREILRTQRTTLNHLFTDGLISEEHYTALVSGIDAALTNHPLDWQDIDSYKTDLSLARWES